MSLLNARLNQPEQTVRIQSVSAAAASSRRFGAEQWQTLERRLQEWKEAVEDARDIVRQAEELAAQQLQQQQNGSGQQGQGGRRAQGERRDQQQQQQQQQTAPKEEIAA